MPSFSLPNTSIDTEKAEKYLKARVSGDITESGGALPVGTWPQHRLPEKAGAAVGGGGEPRQGTVAL